MRTWPGARASFISRSTIWYGPLALTTWAARIFRHRNLLRAQSAAHERHVHHVLGGRTRTCFFGRAK